MVLRLGILLGIVLNFQRYHKIETSFVGLRWLVSVKERKDFVLSLEVCGTHDAFPQSIVNNSCIILHIIIHNYMYIP